jgi:hypothetical protein
MVVGLPDDILQESSVGFGRIVCRPMTVRYGQGMVAE